MSPSDSITLTQSKVQMDIDDKDHVQKQPKKKEGTGQENERTQKSFKVTAITLTSSFSGIFGTFSLPLACFRSSSNAPEKIFERT